MLVIDASAAVEVLLGTPIGQRVLGHLRTEHTLHAPDLLGIEVVSVLRRYLRMGDLAHDDALAALHLLAELGIESYEHGPLLTRCLALHNNLTAYDASYIALAEALQCPLLTCDTALARSSGHRADIVCVE